ncbi:MAG: ATP-dependent DNA helicase PcrA [Phycisphaerae bacterium]|nr:ATP-dependent DNA helicase PcrA [Phycisphaerae bacterium]
MRVAHDSLTDAQRRAVEHVDGAMLVLAGPGSGKTRVITRRIAHLVSLGIPAWQILALTFTNKAAGEMRARVDALVPPGVPGRRGLVVSTFHTFAATLLRHHAEAAGLRPGFVIHDTADQRDAMKRAIADAGVPGRWTPAGALSEVSRLKNALLGPEDAAAQGDFRARAVSRLYEGYQRELAASNAVDFDDLLMVLAKLLKRDETIRRSLVERFRYLLIDEYQDTNHAQFVIARRIAEHGNIMAVGDPDQSIYGWRGADLRNILEFEEAFPGAVVVPLGENFRSTRHIVAAADGLIRHNKRRRHKELTTSLGDGARPAILRCFDEHHEAEQVVRRLREVERTGVPWRGMAVLYRINALSRVVEDALRRESIPYQVVRGTAFFERREVKDALAYLRLVSNPADAAALRRIVNVPSRGLGETSVEKLSTAAREHGVPVAELLHDPSRAGLTARAARSAAELGGLFRRWRELAAKAEASALPDLVAAVLDESGLRAMIAAQTEADAEGEDRSANLLELENASTDFVQERFADGDVLDASDRARAEADAEADAGAAARGDQAPPPARTALDALRAWLESVALVADADAIDPERGAVTLMTLHAAKGLEFPLVAIVGLEEGTLPHARAIENPDEAEEERRLCFVGMTRAERTLILAHTATRLVHGVRQSCIESRFLREIPVEHAERIDLAGDAIGSFPGDEAFDRGAGDFGAARGGRRGGGDGERVFRVDRSEDWHGGTAARSGAGGGSPGADRGGASRGGVRGAPSLAGLSVGTLVRHPIFGMGVVKELIPRAGSPSVRVVFDNAGMKTLVIAYAKLQIVAKR